MSRQRPGVWRLVARVVAHRPRLSGKSHFGVWNRLWKGMADVKAVRWMWKYRFTYVATERGSVATERGSVSAAGGGGPAEAGGGGGRGGSPRVG